MLHFKQSTIFFSISDRRTGFTGVRWTNGCNTQVFDRRTGLQPVCGESLDTRCIQENPSSHCKLRKLSESNALIYGPHAIAMAVAFLLRSDHATAIQATKTYTAFFYKWPDETISRSPTMQHSHTDLSNKAKVIIENVPRGNPTKRGDPIVSKRKGPKRLSTHSHRSSRSRTAK